MLETAIVAFTTFFATIGPLDVAMVFAAMTATTNSKARKSMALRGVLTAGIILLVFAWAGEHLLSALGISLAALRVAGGILLLLIGIEMVFAKPSDDTPTIVQETKEAAGKQDIAIFPLASPLLAGPGAMGAAMLLMANTQGQWVLQLIINAALLLVLLLTLGCLLLASEVQQRIGVTGTHIISRIFGILLTALAVQFIFDGIIQSGVFYKIQ